MKTTVLFLAALAGAHAEALKARLRDLLDTERVLETRLSYRIQELAFEGLSRETRERLRAMAKQYATQASAERTARPIHRPVAGARLIRDWQGNVTVRNDDFEYLGCPYKWLPDIASWWRPQGRYNVNFRSQRRRRNLHAEEFGLPKRAVRATERSGPNHSSLKVAAHQWFHEQQVTRTDAGSARFAHEFKKVHIRRIRR